MKADVFLSLLKQETVLGLLIIGVWDPAKGTPATALTVVIQVVPSGNRQNAGYNIVTAYPS